MFCPENVCMIKMNNLKNQLILFHILIANYSNRDLIYSCKCEHLKEEKKDQQVEKIDEDLVDNFKEVLRKALTVLESSDIVSKKEIAPLNTLKSTPSVDTASLRVTQESKEKNLLDKKVSSSKMTRPSKNQKINNKYTYIPAYIKAPFKTDAKLVTYSRKGNARNSTKVKPVICEIKAPVTTKSPNPISKPEFIFDEHLSMEVLNDSSLRLRKESQNLCRCKADFLHRRSFTVNSFYIHRHHLNILMSKSASFRCMCDEQDFPNNFYKSVLDCPNLTPVIPLLASKYKNVKYWFDQFISVAVCLGANDSTLDQTNWMQTMMTKFYRITKLLNIIYERIQSVCLSKLAHADVSLLSNRPSFVNDPLSDWFSAQRKSNSSGHVSDPYRAYLIAGNSPDPNKVSSRLTAMVFYPNFCKFFGNKDQVRYYIQLWNELECIQTEFELANTLFHVFPNLISNLNERPTNRVAAFRKLYALTCGISPIILKNK